MRRYPQVGYMEQVLREGMQIEDAGISLEDKLRLLDAVGETGLQCIEIGSFVSPRYTPQMACMDELMKRFRPKPGVKYLALALNDRGRERARQYSPPITIEEDAPALRYDMCDVFCRRNINRSQEQMRADWPGTVERALAAGASEASISIQSPWGSNWLGEFPLEDGLQVLAEEYGLWEEAGIPVTCFRCADPMSWATPDRVEDLLLAVKERWPHISYFRLHLHNARGLAMANIYAALRVLGPEDRLHLDGTIGGIGGCPYCGNGQAAGMVPTEDLMHMLESLGIDTGVDLDKLIRCAWLLEEILGRPSFGHVSKAGPRPMTRDRWYPMDLPFIETMAQARHFLAGPSVYEGGIRPWREPIRSPRRPEG